MQHKNSKMQHNVRVPSHIESIACGAPVPRGRVAHHLIQPVGLAAVLVNVLAEASDHFDATFDAFRSDLGRHGREKLVSKRLDDGSYRGADFFSNFGFELVFLRNVSEEGRTDEMKDMLQTCTPQPTHGSMRGFIFSCNVGNNLTAADLAPL
jgi:hypothetical protein